jgi:hypothetical protein
MSFAKPTPKQESGFDEYQRLMCSVSGCPNRWSVKIDKPMCSFHQWGTTAKPKSDIHTALKKPPVKHWNDTDSDEVF